MFGCSRLWRVLSPRQALRILSLSPTANLTPASIKKAYIKETLRCHPDLHPNDPNANENFRTLSDAFRTALKALELQRGAGGLRGPHAAAAGETAARDDEDLYDPQAALESLRQAVLAYRAHQQLSEAAPLAAEAVEAAGVFSTPSLEDVSSVCQREAVAMRRVHTFCADLPAVLCGSHSAALFEAVAFFHARYVESMSACVMRFAQNLPILVRRVVKGRRKHLNNRTSAVVQGIGTGSQPRSGQRIEDMTMKPLVLVGALIFDLPEGETSAKQTPRSSSSSSTCGVTQPSDIRVTSELKCVIYPSDSIADITAKLGKWEAASFQRLKVELAIVDVTRLLSGMLALQDDAAPQQSDGHLSVMPHLAEPRATAEMLLRTLQKLASDLCCHFDPAVDAAVSESVIDAMRLHETSTSPLSQQDDAAAAQAELSLLIAQCRCLSGLARPTLRGSITLTWNTADTAELVQDAEGLAEAAPPPEAPRDTSQQRRPAAPTFVVGRHLTCSTAETLFFSVSLSLTKDLRSFLLRLRSALKQVVQVTNESKGVLFELLPLREATLKEEFIPLPAPTADSDSPYRYRGPIHCFPRVCSMDTKREHELWRHLHAHREFIAAHAPTMNPINIFYECLPYDPASPENFAPPADRDRDLVAGWVGGGSDGCDSVILTARELDEAPAFREWLEEVVAQSSLNREAEETLSKAGVGYVSRDPALPLANYLSFVKVFVQSAAVRAVLERRPGTAPPGGVVTSDDVGLSIIVSPAQCDVRDGGRLFLPWYVDPSILLSLLGDGGTHRQLKA